ncbi:MAG: hypothetical protein OXH94_14700 [Rhodospirillales bacterium]|nr:hypothetical protein [Rhodospirillales bacterium]
MQERTGNKAGVSHDPIHVRQHAILGKTLGIFGYGRIIGRAVADCAKAFAGGSPVNMINPEIREGELSCDLR